MELKHLVFIIALLGVIPASCLCMFSQKFMKLCVYLIPTSLIVYQQTAINFFTNPDYKGTALGFEVSCIFLVAATLLGGMFLRQWPIKFIFPGTLPYFMYFLICTLSLTSSPNLQYSCFELYKMINLFFVYLAVVNYFYMTHDFDSFLWGIATIVFVSFLKAFKMKYFEGRVQVPGVFPHQNCAGMFMCLVGPVILSRILNNKDNIIKSMIFLMIFFMSFLAALFTYSRGSLACFPLGCAITIVLSLVLHFNSKTLMIMILTGALGLLAVIYSGPTIANRFTNAPEASADMRVHLADVAVTIMKAKPLFGCGINTWGIVALDPKYNHHMDFLLIKQRGFIGIVETTYLLVGAECGLLGLGALLCWYLYHLIQAVLQAIHWRHSEHFYLMAGLIGGFTSNYLQSTLEWVLKQQVNFCVLFCCFAIVAALAQSSKEHLTVSKLDDMRAKKEEAQRRREEMLLQQQQSIDPAQTAVPPQHNAF